MKNIVLSLLCMPLLVWSQCPEADRKAFLAQHAPAVLACEPAVDRICLDHPHPVDDDLFRTVVDPHPLFLPKVPPAQVKRWPHDRKDANNIATRQPPGTFQVVADAQRLDLTRRSVFVTCDGAQIYLRDSGGLNNTWDWYGPIPMATLADLKAQRD